MKWKAVLLIVGLPHIAVAAEQFSDPGAYQSAVEAAGVSTQTLIDFEDLNSGTTIDNEYDGLGLNFSSNLSVTSVVSVHGSAARGTLALQVAGDAPQSLTLLFDTPQSAISAYIMDVGAPLTLLTYDSGGLLETIELTDVSAEDTAGGLFKGVVLSAAAERVVFQGGSGDGIGLDDLSFVSLDADLDGYGPGDGRLGGDCDDSNSGVYPGAVEVVDGADQNCDGVVDNAYAYYVSEPAFQENAEASGIDFLTVIDVEDVTAGYDLTDAYEGLGVYLSAAGASGAGTLTSVTDVCGATANGSLAAKVGESSQASYTWFFSEAQTFVSSRILDVGSLGLQVKAYDDGGLVYDFPIEASGEDVARGLFRGLEFHLPVTRVVMSSSSTSDCIGFDDLSFVSLDKDGDGYGPGVGRLGADCDDDDPNTYPGAPELDADGIDQNCDGLVDNAVVIYNSPTDFNEAGEDGGVGAFVKVDFEDLSAGDFANSQYADLGIRMSAGDGIIVDDEAYGSDARERLAGRVVDTSNPEWSWQFTEAQSFVGAYFLDVNSKGLLVSAYIGDTLVNSFELDVSGEDTPGGFFRGMAFSTAVDRLDFSSAVSDGVGFDDVIFDGLDDDQDGYTIGDGDCDDLSAAINPAATEVCNALDDNCDGSIDEGFDLDDDGSTTCAGDCDDDNSDVAPGREEVCDDTDQDCDGSVDEGFDVDDDGQTSCGGDCDDENADINGGAEELCNGFDDNCDESIDEGFDLDGDGFFSCEIEGSAEDCNDSDSGINPGAAEVPYNSIDEDCSGADLVDVDGDGFAGAAVDGLDCNDQDANINPDSTEIPYNDIDEDCSGSDLTDVDGDGFDNGEDCDDDNASTYPDASEIDDDEDNDCDEQVDENLDTTDDDGDGYSESSGDCNDDNSAINPDASEVPYNGLDDDCVGGDLTDVDGDGFDGGDAGPDCDDSDGEINPEASEIPYNAIDEDCSGADLDDQDGDGFVGGDSGEDCDDTNSLIYPGASETPYDGIDQDCDGADDLDKDDDGYDSQQYGGLDCADDDAEVYPNAVEVNDGKDNNCNGQVDEGTDAYDDDFDGYSENDGDCDDTNDVVYPGATEEEDGTDQDCDGRVDEGTDAYDDDLDGYSENDGDCNDAVGEISPGAIEICGNDTDEDCDTFADECSTPTPPDETAPEDTPDPDDPTLPEETPTLDPTEVETPTQSEIETPTLGDETETAFETATPGATPTMAAGTATEPMDGGVTEPEATLTPGGGTDGGCECSTSGSSSPLGALMVGLVLLIGRRRRLFI